MALLVSNPIVVTAASHSGTAVLDFGPPATAQRTATVTVIGQTGISESSQLVVGKKLVVTPDHSVDEVYFENLGFSASDVVAGTSFKITGVCTLGTTYGKFNVFWQWT